MQNFKYAVGYFMGDTVGASLKEGKKVMDFLFGVLRVERKGKKWEMVIGSGVRPES